LYSEEIERMIVEYIYSNDIDIIIDESDDSLSLLDNVSTLSKEEDLIEQLTEKVYNYIIETIER